MKSKALLATILALTFSVLHQSVSPAQAATNCRNSGPQINSLSVGSQVDGKAFTVCAGSTAASSTTSTNKTVAKPTVVDPRVSPKGQVLISIVSSGNNAQVVFRPTTPAASLTPANRIYVGQSVHFSVAKQKLFGYNWMLHRKLGVRFVPVSAQLQLGDGREVSGFATEQTFSNPGTYRLRARVTFAAGYRWLNPGEFVNRKGVRWNADPDLITVNSKAIKLIVLPSPATSSENQSQESSVNIQKPVQPQEGSERPLLISH